MSGRVAVILASTGRGDAYEDSVAGFLHEVGGCGEVVVVEGNVGRDQSALSTPHPNPPPQGGRGPDENPSPLWRRAAKAEEIAGKCTGTSRPKLRILRSPNSRLVPELWRDGLGAVDADLVAFSTTQMVPRAGWLDALTGRLDGSSAWGVGGAIAAGDRLGAVDRAVYLQRFLAYGPDVPLPARPSGENAAYRRDRLMEVEDAWAEGFWEAEVHRRLEDRGGTWASAPGAVVDYAGSTRLLAMARQRVAHARRFGAIRASGRVDRWARGLATPLVPAVLLVRAGRGLMRRGMAVRPWLGAVPSFLLIAGAWAVGETLGAWSGRAGP